MKRKVFSSLISFVLIVGVLFSLSVSANAASNTVSGTMYDTSSSDGGYIRWVYTYDTYTGRARLSLSGNGYMPNGTDQDWFQAQREAGCYIYEVTVEEGVKSIMSDAFAGEIYLESVTLPDSLEFIGENAFAYTPLESFHIPKNLRDINANIFVGSNIKKFTVDSQNSYYKSSGGNLYSKDMSTLVVAAPGKFEDSSYKFTIPKSVKTIGENAFYCTAIESITIPSNVRNIDKMAFAGCSELSDVNIRDGVLRLYDSVFLACDSLKELHLPASVNYIGYCTIGYIYEVDLDELKYQLQAAGMSSLGLNESNYELYAAKLGLSGDAFLSCVVDPQFTLYAPKNSAGENYANNFDVDYVCSSNLRSVVNKQNGIQITWTYSDEVLYTQLYKKTLNGSWKKIKQFDVEQTSYLDTDVTENTDVVYSLKVAYLSGDEHWDTGGIIGSFVSSPVLEKIKNTAKGVRVDWQKKSGMKYFYVYRKAQGETSWDYIARVSGTKTYYVDNTVKNGESYSYTVRANNGTASSYLNGNGLSETYVKSPTFKVYNTIKGVSVRWTSVEDATAYNVYRKTSSTSWKCIKVAAENKTSFADTTAKRGTTYTYAVRAVMDDAMSGFESKTIKSIAAPMSLKVQNRVSGVKVLWNKCAGAEGYYVYRKNSSGKWVKIATVKGNANLSYLDRNVKSGKNYSYTVKAYGGSSVSTYDSTGVKIKFLATPKINSAVSTKNGINLKYNVVSGSKGYYIYRETLNGSKVCIGTVTNQKTTTYVDKTAKKGQTYIYTVRAYNGNTLSGCYTNGIKVKDIY